MKSIIVSTAVSTCLAFIDPVDIRLPNVVPLGSHQSGCNHVSRSVHIPERVGKGQRSAAIHFPPPTATDTWGERSSAHCTHCDVRKIARFSSSFLFYHRIEVDKHVGMKFDILMLWRDFA
jgi:hypothetical protein